MPVLKGLKRFIDDLIVICGDEENLIDFGCDLNTNNKNIKLSQEIGDFLDVEMRREGEELVTDVL